MQTIARERIGRHVQDAHHERPFAPGEGRRSDPGRCRRVAHGTRRVAQLRVVDQVAADGADEVQRPGHDRRPAPRRVPARARRSGRVRRSTSAIARRRSPPTGRQLVGGHRTRRRRRVVAMTVAPSSEDGLGQGASTMPSTSLSAIGAHHERQRSRRQVRSQIVERLGERSRAGRVVGAVEQDLVRRRPSAARAGPARPPSRSRGDERPSSPSRSPPRRARRGLRRRPRRWRPGDDRGARPGSARGGAARRSGRRGPSRGAARAPPPRAARRLVALGGG